MMSTFVGEKQEDFIARMLRLIEEQRHDEVVNEIMKLELHKRFDALIQILEKERNVTGSLHIELFSMFSLASALDLSRVLELISDFERVRTHASNAATASTLALAGALELALEFVSASVHARASTTDGNSASALALASTLSLARARASDVASDISRARATFRIIDRARDHAHILAHVLDRALDHARLLYQNTSHLNHIFEFWTSIFRNLDTLHLVANVYPSAIGHKYVSETSRSQLRERYSVHLANVLDEALYLQRLSPSPILDTIVRVIQATIGDDLRHITLEGVTTITPEILIDEIAPYLKALSDIQRVYVEIAKKLSEGNGDAENRQPRIVSIHNEMPKVEIVDAAETIRAVNEVLTRRHREQDARKRDLEIEQLEILNERERINNQGHLNQLAIEQDQAVFQAELDARIALIWEEVRAKQLENDKRAIENERELRQIDHDVIRIYSAIAADMLKQMFPDGLLPEDLINYTLQLIDGVKTISESRLTMRLGHHDAPRPTTLPEIDG